MLMVIDCDVLFVIVMDKDVDGFDIICYLIVYLFVYVVKELYLDVQVMIGLVIDNGFYYDFLYNCLFMLEDFEKIEKCMQEFVKKDELVMCCVVLCDEVVGYFCSIGEKYKVEIIELIL